MDKEIKKLFETELSSLLKKLNIPARTRSLKKSIKFESLSTENKAELAFSYLGSQKAYYIELTGYSGEFSYYIQKIVPPYKSNMVDGFSAHFYMTTLQEKSHSHAQQLSKIYLPHSDHVLDLCINQISDALNGFYIPYLMAFVDFNPSLIHYIVQRPDFYSYPIPMIAYVLEFNGLKWSDLNLPIGKKIIRDREFDEALLQI